MQGNKKINKQKPSKGSKPIVTEPSKNNKNYRYVSLAVIILLTIIVYSNSIKNDFITNYDDKAYIIDSPYLRNLNFESIKSIFSNYYVANYHPLTTLTWAIEYSFFKLNPIPYHADNLILHLLNILLVFQLIYLMTKRYDASAIVAMLFAIHPMHVESVSWISERKDVLYSFFYLCSLVSYVYYLKANYNIKHLLLSLIFFILSAFSKSAAITLPIVFLLIDYYYTRNINYKLIIEKIPFFIISIIFGYVALISQKSVGAVNQLYDFNFIDKIFLFTYSVFYYSISFIFPSDFALIHYYPQKVNGMLPYIYYASPVFIIAIIIIVFKSRKFKKDLIFGFSFFFAGLLLILQFIPLGPSIVSERYTYIPYIGLAFIVSRIYISLTDKKTTSSIKSYKLYYIIALGCLSLFFVVSTFYRNKIWKNSLTLFEDLVLKYPKSDMANYNYGYANYLYKNYEEAIKYFDRTINMNHNYTTAYVSRGLCKHFLKDYAGAIPDFDKAIKSDPNYSESYNNRGTAKAMLKDYSGAIKDYNKAIELKPEYSTYVNRANAKLMLNDYANALDDYNICLKTNTQDPVLYYNRGISEYNVNQHEQACNDWHIALQAGYEQANDKIKLFCK